jgi:hypothetical protein
MGLICQKLCKKSFARLKILYLQYVERMEAGEFKPKDILKK